MRSLTFRRNRLVVLALGLFLSAVTHALAQDVRVETQQQARARNENTLEQEAAPEEVTDPELGDINLVSRAPQAEDVYIFDRSNTELLEQCFPRP